MADAEAKGGSAIGRILRTVLWAVLIAFSIGFFIGTLLRRELDKPVRFIGRIESPGPASTRPLPGPRPSREAYSVPRFTQATSATS
ncbi:MAG: hypothetical protein AB8G23_11605 [Myxococcota bacterium]